MEPERLLLWSQVCAAGPCAEPDNSVNPLAYYFKDPFQFSFPPMLWSSKWSLSFSSASKTIRIFSSPLRSTFLVHLILVGLIALKYLVRYTSHEPPPLHNLLRPPVPLSEVQTLSSIPSTLTPSAFFPYCETHHVSKPCKTTGKLQRTYCGNCGHSGTGFTFCANDVVF